MQEDKKLGKPRTRDIAKTIAINLALAFGAQSTADETLDVLDALYYMHRSPPNRVKKKSMLKIKVSLPHL
ncbi:MAG: hypothetical protein AB8B83_01950 [Bdellovibrionales bacterium]